MTAHNRRTQLLRAMPREINEKREKKQRRCSMGKTIKFNLICDGTPVRTTEDLRNHFSVEDVLEYYNNGLLVRWLAVRQYESELEKVKGICATEAVEIVKALAEIFEVETDRGKLAEDTYIVEYRKKRKEDIRSLEAAEYEVEQVVQRYHKGYQELVDTITDNKDNMPKIKAAVAEIDRSYFKLFRLNHRNLLNLLIQSAPMAVFAMLMNENMRKCYLLTEEEENRTKEISADKAEMNKKIAELLRSYENLKEILGDNLKEFSGKTDSYWKDIEPKGKQYMILRIESGNYVREAGVSGGDKGTEDINNKFLIFDGIDYMSNSVTARLLYMEVEGSAVVSPAVESIINSLKDCRVSVNQLMGI